MVFAQNILDRLYRRSAEAEMDRGLYLYLDSQRLAVCCGLHRPLLAEGRRLVDEGRVDPEANALFSAELPKIKDTRLQRIAHEEGYLAQRTNNE